MESESRNAIRHELLWHGSKFIPEAALRRGEDIEVRVEGRRYETFPAVFPQTQEAERGGRIVVACAWVISYFSSMSVSPLLGVAGEHYVMSQLLRQGFIAALAPVGVPMADIIFTDNIGKRLGALQVKTRRELGGDGGWHMKAKHEKDPASSLFFVFLSFPKEERLLPDLFVLPSELVAEILSLSYSTWLKLPGKNGKAHKETDMRRLRPDYTDVGLSGNYGPGWLEQYRDGWGQLRAKANG